MPTPPFSVALALLALHVLIAPTQSLRFYVQDRERRCFKFEAPLHSRILGHASVENGHGGSADLSIEIRDGTNKVIYEAHSSQRTHSSFSFDTTGKGLPRGRHGVRDAGHAPDPDDGDPDPDEYDYDEREMDGWFSACLVLEADRHTHDASARRAVSFWVRPQNPHPNAPDEAGPRASNDRVVSMERDLLQMHHSLQSMAADIVSLQQKERRLVQHSRVTASRLVWYAVLALIVMAATSALQYSHLVTYFKGKKLL